MNWNSTLSHISTTKALVVAGVPIELRVAAVSVLMFSSFLGKLPVYFFSSGYLFQSNERDAGVGPW